MDPVRAILLSVSGGVWMARFCGDADVVRLFGTDTVPTPFMSNVPAARVLSELRELNPGVRVEVAL